MVKRNGFVALGLLLAVTLGPAAAFAKDKITAVMSTHGFVYLPALVADALGYFEQEDLAVSITLTGGESKSLAALIGGGAEVYVGSPATALRARASGTDPLVVGATTTQFASNLVISGAWAKKHGITELSSYQDKLKALKGATLAITAPGSGTDLIVRFLSKQAGLNPDRDLTITALGTADTMTAAITQGRIDGFSLSAPAAENIVKNHGGVMLFNFTKGEVKQLDGFLFIGVVVRESWAKQNPDVMVRYLRAQQRALNAIHDPNLTTVARDAVWKKYHSKVEQSFFNYVWNETVPAYPNSVAVNADQMRRVVEFVNEFEKQPLDPDFVEKGWTDQYAKSAIATLKK